jgi:hypothetical protein
MRLKVRRVWPSPSAEGQRVSPRSSIAAAIEVTVWFHCRAERAVEGDDRDVVELWTDAVGLSGALGEDLSVSTVLVTRPPCESEARRSSRTRQSGASSLR